MATFYHTGSDILSGQSLARVDSLVLGTVNAPFKRAIDAETLEKCLKTGHVAPWIPHVSTFFSEVEPRLVLAFAKRHGISAPRLAGTYMSVKQETGIGSEVLETSLVPLANPA